MTARFSPAARVPDAGAGGSPAVSSVVSRRAVQFAEQHGEFISSEHTATRRLAASFGLTLDNVSRYPPHTHPRDERLRFGGRFWRQASLNREWRDWAFELFFDAANRKAPWPTLHDRHTAWTWRWGHMPATQWDRGEHPGGLQSDFGRLCVAVLLDEYGLYTDRIVQGGWETTVGQPGKPAILVALPGGAAGAARTPTSKSASTPLSTASRAGGTGTSTLAASTHR